MVASSTVEATTWGGREGTNLGSSPCAICFRCPSTLVATQLELWCKMDSRVSTSSMHHTHDKVRGQRRQCNNRTRMVQCIASQSNIPKDSNSLPIIDNVGSLLHMLCQAHSNIPTATYVCQAHSKILTCKVNDKVTGMLYQFLHQNAVRFQHLWLSHMRLQQN